MSLELLSVDEVPIARLTVEWRVRKVDLVLVAAGLQVIGVGDSRVARELTNLAELRAPGRLLLLTGKLLLGYRRPALSDLLCRPQRGW